MAKAAQSTASEALENARRAFIGMRALKEKKNMPGVEEMEDTLMKEMKLVVAHANKVSDGAYIAAKSGQLGKVAKAGRE